LVKPNVSVDETRPTFGTSTASVRVTLPLPTVPAPSTVNVTDFTEKRARHV
jgi:hypothetical protein